MLKLVYLIVCEPETSAVKENGIGLVVVGEKATSYSGKKAAETKQVIDLMLSQTHKSSLLSEPINKANALFEVSEGLNKDHILLLEGKYFIKKSSGNWSNIRRFFGNFIKVNISY